MEIGEEHEALAQRGYSARERLLDLEHELGPPKTSSTDAIRRADRLVRRVRERAALPGPGLDDHLVPAPDELARARRCQRDAVLVGLDLLGDADLHGARRSSKVEQQPDQALGVLDLAEARLDLRDRPADELERLVLLGARLARPRRPPRRRASSARG